MAERVDISKMSDAEKADMYREHVQDMNDRAPTAPESSSGSATQAK